MVLTTSLIEMNNDIHSIKRILRSLPTDLLKKLLRNVFNDFIQQYPEVNYPVEAFNHVIIYFIISLKQILQIKITDISNNFKKVKLS
jgi:hypothetical protein